MNFHQTEWKWNFNLSTFNKLCIKSTAIAMKKFETFQTKNNFFFLATFRKLLTWKIVVLISHFIFRFSFFRQVSIFVLCNFRISTFNISDLICWSDFFLWVHKGRSLGKDREKGRKIFLGSNFNFPFFYFSIQPHIRNPTSISPNKSILIEN